ncbi:Cell division transport system ATP-binding protein [Flavobacterium sinopsychrotolerans]|uniref:Cell division ATP-binding protein FtsE n=3 Tax=Flavobacteriaceae TaxID=49546 RepID=A0A1H8HLF5_9FLAO|nr:cell division transport system ATP-binding protein [Flavobacterium sinopsychrotolerans]
MNIFFYSLDFNLLYCNINQIKHPNFSILFVIFVILSNTTEFILNRTVILLLLPNKQMQIMSQSVLSLKNVTIYQEGKSILTEVNLEVKHGEFLYIIGKTGSGKSSLMKTLYADLPLTEGEGHIVDFDLATLKEDDIPFLRRKIGIVFQDFKLLPDRTVNDNMLFVLKATGWTDNVEMQNKIDEVLNKVGMRDFGKKMPHQLSGGEQQRVAIARALLNDPELILADEPTGNLDPQTSAEVLEVLKKINANGKTIIMATHDYALLMKFPSKTLKCEDAKIFEVIQQRNA